MRGAFSCAPRGSISQRGRLSSTRAWRLVTRRQLTDRRWHFLRPGRGKIPGQHRIPPFPPHRRPERRPPSPTPRHDVHIAHPPGAGLVPRPALVVLGAPGGAPLVREQTAPARACVSPAAQLALLLHPAALDGLPRRRGNPLPGSLVRPLGELVPGEPRLRQGAGPVLVEEQLLVRVGDLDVRALEAGGAQREERGGRVEVGVLCVHLVGVLVVRWAVRGGGFEGEEEGGERGEGGGRRAGDGVHGGDVDEQARVDVDPARVDAVERVARRRVASVRVHLEEVLLPASHDRVPRCVVQPVRPGDSLVGLAATTAPPPAPAPPPASPFPVPVPVQVRHHPQIPRFVRMHRHVPPGRQLGGAALLDAEIHIAIPRQHAAAPPPPQQAAVHDPGGHARGARERGVRAHQQGEVEVALWRAGERGRGEPPVVVRVELRLGEVLVRDARGPRVVRGERREAREGGEGGGAAVEGEGKGGRSEEEREEEQRVQDTHCAGCAAEWEARMRVRRGGGGVACDAM
ncbi:hypothetical protein B5807_02426 [Epicoccum nigrum]|uniref:Uncharacterized protein n=1 Tax=Epicoccum nigrum TaxID=105696 RepID=A0A1Y2M9E9_EPING|nr:hypothetical protein B5807_02426 [Epicoccum nigrum]